MSLVLLPVPSVPVLVLVPEVVVEADMVCLLDAVLRLCGFAPPPPLYIVKQTAYINIESLHLNKAEK